MKNNYKKILKKNAKKQSTGEALFGIYWEDIKMVCIASIVFILGYGFNMYALNLIDICGKSTTSVLIVSFMLTIIEILILYCIGLILYGAYEWLFITMPVLLQRRYLPLTIEEIKALPFKTNEEFYDFLFHICSRKNIFTKERQFVKGIRVDAIQMLNLYNNINEQDAFYLDESIPRELSVFLNIKTKSFVKSISTKEINILKHEHNI